MKQEKALALLKAGKNVFLTGQAGAGKTYVLNQYIAYLRERKVSAAITASTGIAATHMNGQTIHAWSGIGIKDYISPVYVHKLLERKYFKDRMERVRVLIIDEISMLHRRQLDLVNMVLQVAKENNDAFGGIQVIFSGDFFQLPPIGEQGETNRDKFAFMSDAWQQASPIVCYLHEQFRQDDSDLNGILNKIRSQNIDQKAIELLAETQYNDLQEDTSTQLFTHNADVDAVNQQKLAELATKTQKFKAKTKGNKVLGEVLKRSILTDESLELKKGAQVMFIKNNYEQGYFNGTLGEVVYFTDKGFPMVELRNRKHIEVKPEVWAIQDDMGKDLASFEQIPLRLAWAITVHKSQGMTLDAARMDLRRTFEPGQGYVALSRVRNLKGLNLLGMNETAIQVDGLAFKADQRFQELSSHVDAEYNLEFLKTFWNSYVRKCGGITDEKEIKKQRDKIKRTGPKAVKKSTYEQSKELADKGLGLKEIAEQRGLQETTIISHLTAIKKKYPDWDASRFKPEPDVMQIVKQAYDEALQNGKEFSKKNLYEAQMGKISYQDMALAMLHLANFSKEEA